jgi:hypothetical protein
VTSVQIITLNVETITTDDIIATLTLPASSITVTDTPVITLDVETFTTIDIVQTVTTTASPPPTTTCNPFGPQPTFGLSAVAPGIDIDGGYAEVSGQVIYFHVSSFDAGCYLVDISSGPVLVESTGYTEGAAVFESLSDPGNTPAVCDVVDGLLKCEDQGSYIWIWCDGYPLQYSDMDYGVDGCTDIQLQALFWRVGIYICCLNELGSEGPLCSFLLYIYNLQL